MKHLSTELIHNGNGQYYKKIAESQSVPETLPVYFSSVFTFDDVPSVDDIYEHRADGYVYSRMKNPNADAVSEILAKAEGAEAGLVFSSGMSAIILSILAVVSAGDHIISSPVLYGGVHDFLSNELARYGVSVTFVDFLNDDIEKFIRPETKLIYTESLSNPLLEVPDYKKTADIAHKHGLLFYIDNTFATSVVVRPYKYGADLVLYSATKYLGGHSDIIGGAAVGRKEVIDRIQPKLVLYGAVLSPAESWLLARSLRTLQLRVRKHSDNALAVARFLESHPKIERVYYPGLESSPSHELAKAQFEDGHFGGMLSADIRGGEKEASAVIANLGFIKFVPSLAGTATSVSYAVKTSHRAYSDEELKKAGITAGQLRFSIGLEEAEDIIAEISAALDKI